MKKRLFLAFLCLALAVGSLPLTALAEEAPPAGCLKLECVSPQAGVVGAVGDKISVDFRLTNAGSTIITMKSFESTDAEGRDAPEDKAVFSSGWDWLAPDGSLSVTLTVTVTQADLAAGSIRRGFLVSGESWLHTETGLPATERDRGTFEPDGRAVFSNQVFLRLPLTETSTGQIQLDCTTNLSALTDAEGDALTVSFQAVNVGQTILAATDCQSVRSDGSATDDQPAFSSDRNWLAPGAVLPLNVTIKITEEDRRAGAIRRGITLLGANWLDEETGAPFQETGNGIASLDGKKLPSNTVLLDIPLENPSASGLQLKCTDDLTGVTGSPGEALPVTFTVTNTGSTILSVNGYENHGADGENVPEDAAVFDSGWDWLCPNEALPVTLTLKVTQSDVDAGMLHRSFSVSGECWLNTETGLPASDRDQGTFECGGPAVRSNTVTIKIPLTKAVSPDYGKSTDCRKDSSCPLAGFTDLNTAGWYHDGIHFCLANALMRGTSDAVFSPAGTATRGQIVTMLYRLEGEPDFLNANPYSDVAAGSYYENAVIWASGRGIITGYGADRFAPNAPITREQLAVILYRYAVYKVYDMGVLESTTLQSFEDHSAVSDYAVPSVLWAFEKGLLQGDAGKLMPLGNAERTQVATIFYRFIENLVPSA